ncbi:MAG TPA: YCF48-related protein [Bryobacteraceae bacterium]|jgi:photosystem II stability/assembly factor-like uncharacterized protein|nr:YCF48-related protein [Bryobacteraceae bacterium]
MSRSLISLAAVMVAAGSLAFGADPHWDIQYRYRQIDSTLTINDIAFPSVTRGIACGQTTGRNEKARPLVLLTSDGGTHWTENPVKDTCLSMFFLDDSNGWMVTDDSIWATTESGHNWTKLNKAPSGLLRVWFLDKQHGFAAGLQKRVVETTDGGATWTPLAILKEIGDPKDARSLAFLTFGEISFEGNNGIISGWNVPPTRGGPDWMQPEAVSKRKQVPHYTVLLQTTDAGKTWFKGEASLFGEATRLSMTTQGTGLGLLEFRDEFEFPSEVYRINLHGGASESSYKTKEVAITDVKLFNGSNRAFIAGYETAGKVYRSPIPGKLRILTSTDRENWTEMPVDYRAVAHGAMITGPDEDHVWVATDTGSILKLVKE